MFSTGFNLKYEKYNLFMIIYEKSNFTIIKYINSNFSIIKKEDPINYIVNWLIIELKLNINIKDKNLRILKNS